MDCELVNSASRWQGGVRECGDGDRSSDELSREESGSQGEEDAACFASCCPYLLFFCCFLFATGIGSLAHAEPDEGSVTLGATSDRARS